MAAYTRRLAAYTPAQNKPVTEIAIFKLNPEFALDHAAAAVEFESQVVQQTAPGKTYAKGIRRISWGFSRNDPETFVWMLDWDKIQDHWEFWQTPGFQPVSNTISKMFKPGRPLVRHYDFGGQGMIEAPWVRLFVFDEKSGGTTPETARAKVLKTDASTTMTARQAYAVDLDETTWYCLLLGYDSEIAAAKEQVHTELSGEDHVIELKYSSQP
ncbi:hypothetical protein PFICI_10033 [Pestalotiopsis fici W106-1]|uniref:ABM domain-containing protein n=1 Tax=Pestalotiopsis fici (strain W106-1 / CGMCC3.15140) TaxID=1229662 RepID=W3WYK4_PESFW|nr:uncharacterized protein PFICI_10033 [Pestalotiopsis fici W106-1]ETS77971.1 hypothetical protein PFICI_10033 [Pestalotiopsis fici W106-1]